MPKYKTEQSGPIVQYKTARPILLDCPKCHSFISASDIDITKGEATCSHCDHQFSFQDQLKKDPYRRPEMIMPDGVDVLRISSMLDIVIDWYKSAPKKRVLGLIGSSFFWNIILIPIFIYLALQGEFFFILLFIGHFITGISLMWYLLATLVNKTHIEVNQKGINIKHTPVPTFNNRSLSIPKEKIKQLYVTRYTDKIGKKKEAIQAYALSAILDNNKVIDLVKGMDKDTQLYLEQEIETYLGIKDKLIKGEISRYEK